MKDQEIPVMELKDLLVYFSPCDSLHTIGIGKSSSSPSSFEYANLVNGYLTVYNPEFVSSTTGISQSM